MGWEPADRWPGESGGGGAFRAGSEPAIAERGGPTFLERLKLFWHSTPEMPLGSVARRAVLTATYVYVDRFDGRRERVARSALRGIRRSGGRLVIGVREGEDLVLPFRPRCALSRHLLEQLGGTTERWVGWRDVFRGALLAVVGLGFAVGLFATYPLPRVLHAWSAAGATGEAVLGFVAGWVALAVGVVGLAWLPTRVSVDRLGVEVRRGLLPWLPFFLPAERVRAVLVRRRFWTRARTAASGYVVVLDLHRDERLGSPLPRRRIEIHDVDGSQGDAAAQREAAQVAERVADRLGAPFSP